MFAGMNLDKSMLLLALFFFVFWLVAEVIIGSAKSEESKTGQEKSDSLRLMLGAVSGAAIYAASVLVVLTLESDSICIKLVNWERCPRVPQCGGQLFT